VVPADIKALRQGDNAAWDAAFDWLWPTVISVTQLKLGPFFPSEIEDVAIEALEELVAKVREVETIEELKPLAASIAHNRAVSLLRERFAKKRGEGKTVSLDQPSDPSADDSNPKEPPSAKAALDELGQKELASLLGELLRELKPEYRCVLEGAFLQELKQEQIAERCKLSLGSVGVYLQRARESFRKIIGRYPKLLKELEAYLR
jgi:RNA polymerase sigma factor (sigma-70 family)